MIRTPLVLTILDGYGLDGKPGESAIDAARTPNLNTIFKAFPNCRLSCSGLAVGLPDGQMGNSEVGHTNMGAGRVVYQELTRITKSVNDGDFFSNAAFIRAAEHAKSNGGKVHLMGLVSDGGVHSHMTHIFALMQLMRRQDVPTYIHCLLDGRDTAPESGAGFVAQVEAEIERLGGELHIATVMGRFFAMDRDKRWDRLEKAYRAMVYGEAPAASSAPGAVRESYAAGVTDEFMLPVMCDSRGTIEANDSVIFFNFRPDRAREITRALVDPEFAGFERQGGAIKPFYVCMTQYEADMPNVTVAYPPSTLDDGFGEYISRNKLTQLRIAETEKYAHVTFFFNGGEERQFSGESRILVPSPTVATYDLKPEMSAFEVTDKCVSAIESGSFDVIILNLANCDMVGHTGIFDAAVKAVETVDTCVGTLLAAVNEANGTMIITADHGNADKMVNADGTPHTAHTTSQVPFILCKRGFKLRDGALCDIAPTMLQLLDLVKPSLMTGNSLIVE